jgi:uncharacterized protein (TIGR03083 family)
MIPRLDHEQLLQVLAIEAGVLAGVASDAPSGARVPHCPGLTLGETVRHLGALYRASLTWITTGRKPIEWQREPGPDQSLLDFYRIGLRDVMSELAAHDADDRCATWSGTEKTYQFWSRRLAHETTIHRVDVQGAAGVPVTAIDADAAIDGADEILRQWFVWKLRALGIRNTQNATVSVRCEGVEGAWLVKALRGEETEAWWMPDLAQDRSRIDGTVVARDPQALYLWLWGRASPWGDPRPNGTQQLVFTGPGAVTQLWALLRLGTR